MGQISPNLSSAAEWLKHSEDVLRRITADLAADEEQVARTRDMLAASYRLLRKLDRRTAPSTE
jgi:hypothetical protein